jgi:hypothetical protein
MNTRNTREEYLISFLRGCAEAADRGELGVNLGRLLVNGDLMREAADEFERLLPDREEFKDLTEELHYNLVRAEQHARQAHDMLYKKGPDRSIWFRMALGRAQSILMSLYVQERRRT